MEFNLNEALNIVSRTADTLDSMLKDLPEQWADANEGTGTWNAKQILQHLIFGEQTDWIPRIELILSDREDKTFEPFDQDNQFAGLENKTLKSLLQEFRTIRNVNLQKITDLKLDYQKLEREGSHPALGVVKLRELLSAMVVHDLNHIHQISRVLARQYENEVGPWKQFLGVLKS